jgi:hypothetical protein
MCVNRVVSALLAFPILQLLVAGCTIVSGADSYGPNPVPQTIKGSYSQGFKSYVVEHDAPDVKNAVIKAAGTMGLAFNNMENNRLSGSGSWVYVGFKRVCMPDLKYVVYIRESGKRITAVTFIVDSMTYCESGYGPDFLIRKLAATMNSVLATHD